jgi:hypothetical protein
MDLNLSMKELFYTLEFQRRNSTCRFFIAIMGRRGEVTALIAEKSEPETEAKPKMKKLQLHLKLKRRKKQRNLFTRRESLLSPCHD